jgi:hypothetical protein
VSEFPDLLSNPGYDLSRHVRTQADAIANNVEAPAIHELLSGPSVISNVGEKNLVIRFRREHGSLDVLGSTVYYRQP